MAVSPDGKFLAVASHDNHIRIYNCDGWSLCSTIVKHTSAVLMIDWSCDSKWLRSNSLNSELFYWKIDDAGLIKHDPEGNITS